MVHLARSLVVVSSLFALVFAIPTKRTAAQVEADLRNISTQVTNLDTQIKGFPASGLAGALAIHNAATPLTTALNTAATDTSTNGPVDDTDGNAILAIVQGFQPTILDALTRLVADKAAFASEPISGLPALVHQDLVNLLTATQSLAAALIANAPPDLQPTASVIENAVLSAITSAVQAYAT
ncbi:hydrophobic surface binding protein [Mycena amicta]|nr:hydrophobic surface binding protein [Mycena amicta]